MWVMSRYGFFSIVNKLDKGQPADKPLQIRTRWDEHIDRLRVEFPFLSEPVSVSRSSDYSPRRIYASHEEAAKVMAGIATAIDYGNFKGYMDRDPMFLRDGFGHALHEIWSVIYDAYNRARAKPAAHRNR